MSEANMSYDEAAVERQIQRDFVNHRPDEDTQANMETVRERYHHVVRILAQLPKSRETSLAVTNLEQSLMWAMASLARDSKDRNESV